MRVDGLEDRRDRLEVHEDSTADGEPLRAACLGDRDRLEERVHEYTLQAAYCYVDILGATEVIPDDEIADQVL